MHILSNSLCAPDFQEILSIYLIVVKANPALNLFNYSTSFTNSRNFKQHPMKQQHLIFNLASYIYFFIKLHINLPFFFDQILLHADLMTIYCTLCSTIFN